MESNSDTTRKIRGLIVSTAVVVVAGVNYRYLVDVAAGLIHIVWPFILGVTTVFILNVPIRNTERHLPVFGEGSRLRRPVSLVAITLLVTKGLFLVISVMAPRLVKTFLNPQGSTPVSFAGVRNEVERIFVNNPQIPEYVNQLEVNWQEVLQSMAAFLKGGAETILNTTFSATVSIINGVSSFLTGSIFATYTLLQKETLGRQMKKVLAVFLPEPAVGRTLDTMAPTEHTFSDFLTGQCVEATILETIFLVTPIVIRPPYALLIGVLIVFMALILIFGAFVGLAVGAFLILMVNPMDALVFTITFFVLQQIKGNLVHPYVVGNPMGFPSIRILVTVTMGGSMMGIVGMPIFIPLYSVLYALLKGGVNVCLRRRGRGESVCKPVCVAVSEENGDQERQG